MLSSWRAMCSMKRDTAKFMAEAISATATPMLTFCSGAGFSSRCTAEKMIVLGRDQDQRAFSPAGEVLRLFVAVKVWLLSGGRWAMLIAVRAISAAARLTKDLMASDNRPTEPVKIGAELQQQGDDGGGYGEQGSVSGDGHGS